jgi:hypothetical protein
MEDIEMGNQQATDLEIGWMAGILDGEGSISMRAWPYKGKIHFVVSVSVSNTSRELLTKFSDICSKLGVNLHWISKSVPSGNLPGWDIETKKISHCARILRSTIANLTSKQEKASLVLSFCERRLAFAKECVENGTDISKKYPYNDDDWAFFREFAERFHHKTKTVTSTTIPMGVGLKGARSAGQAKSLMI